MEYNSGEAYNSGETIQPIQVHDLRDLGVGNILEEETANGLIPELGRILNWDHPWVTHSRSRFLFPVEVGGVIRLVNASELEGVMASKSRLRPQNDFLLIPDISNAGDKVSELMPPWVFRNLGEVGSGSKYAHVVYVPVGSLVSKGANFSFNPEYDYDFPAVELWPGKDREGWYWGNLERYDITGLVTGDIYR